jgi:hypothetical protein
MKISNSKRLFFKISVFSALVLFFALGIFLFADAACPYSGNGCTTCENNYNYSNSSCYNPGDWEGQCTTCYQQQNSCDNWGPNYCYSGNVYRQRNCYRTDSNGTRTNYADNQVVQYCVAGQTCQNGICAVQQQNYCDSFGAVYCVGNAVYQQRTCHRVDAFGNSAYSDAQLLQTCAASQTCQSGICVRPSAPTPIPTPTYFLHYRKACFSGNLFWLDSKGERQDQAQNCTDANECTADSCSASRCINELKCDGSTCSVGSEDYCEKCKHCGDGVCGCGETPETCNDDCKIMSGLPIAVFGKMGNESVQWFKNLAMKGGEKIDFLVVVSNNEKDNWDNVIVKVMVPEGIQYKGDLKIDGKSFSGDVRDGINIGSLVSKSAKTITFKGETEAAKNLTKNETEVVGTIAVQNLNSSDLMKIAFEESRAGLTASAGIFKTLFSRGYVLPLLITIVILIFVGRMIYVWFLKK